MDGTSNCVVNSPDFNISDLGLFNAIQALQHRLASTNIDHSLKLPTTKCIDRHLVVVPTIKIRPQDVASYILLLVAIWRRMLLQRIDKLSVDQSKVHR